jgi:hypothetical protein
MPVHIFHGLGVLAVLICKSVIKAGSRNRVNNPLTSAQGGTSPSLELPVVNRSLFIVVGLGQFP